MKIMNRRLLIFGIMLGVVSGCGAMSFEEDAPEETPRQQLEKQLEKFFRKKYEGVMSDALIDKMVAAWIALNSGDTNSFIDSLHKFDKKYNEIQGESQEAKNELFVETQDEEGYTPFLRAVKNGSTDIVITLLGRSGTDAQATINGKNAFDIVAQELDQNPSEENKKRYTEIVRLLAKADVPLSKKAAKSNVLKGVIVKALGNTKGKILLYGK